VVPKLRNLSSKMIHNLSNYIPNDLSYDKPMVNHSIETKITKEIFGSLR
jgi:deoxyribodipyrimidine photolyase